MNLRKSAFIIPLGLLNEAVNAAPFIKYMLDKASEKNVRFKQEEVLKNIKFQAFLLAEKFNKGEIVPDDFKRSLLNLLDLTDMNDAEFWEQWNAMIKVGDINRAMTDLKNFASDQRHSLLYLVSDTNIKQAEHLQKLYKENGVELKLERNSATLENIPLYLSYQARKNRTALIKDLQTTIDGLTFGVQETVLIVGNPNNVEDMMQRQLAKKEVDDLQAWCKENGNVRLVQHAKQDSVVDTLQRVVTPVVEEQSCLKLA